MLWRTQILRNKYLKDGTNVFTNDILNSISHFVLLWHDFSFVQILESGRLDLVQWWCQINGRPSISEEDVYLVLCDAKPCYGRPYLAVDVAAGLGHLDIAIWLQKEFKAHCSPKAMINAAGNGYLDVVKWLNNSKIPSNNGKAITYAARNGHLDIIRYLHMNRNNVNSNFTKNAIKFE
jgi:hypothetical protein